MKIPRDAARPKLEDLQLLYDEIPHLPFQADEEEVLKAIIDNAQEFRNVVSPLCDSALSTPEEAETQRFYLRKIEGAEVLLTRETNFFRQELHKWCPVAPEPPPLLEVSKSTRKPRPTKLQKMFNEHGVSSIEELPEHLISKAKSLHRKMLNAAAAERDREKLSALREQEMNGGGAMAYALNSSVAQSSRPGDSLHNSSRDGSSRGASITSPAAVDNNAFLGHDGGRRRSTSPLGSGFSHRPSGGAAAAAPGGAGGSAVQTPQQQQHQGHSRTSSGGGISRSGRNKDGGDSSAAGGRSKYDDDEGGGRGLSPMSEDDPLDYDSSWGGPLGSYGDRHRQGSHGYSGGYGSHDEPAARGLTAGSDSFGRHDPVLGGTAGNRRSSDAVAVGDDPAAAAADEEAAAAGQGSIFQELIQDGARYGEDDDDGVGGTVKPDDVFMLDTVED